jgi:site-specific recombinase XerD
MKTRQPQRSPSTAALEGAAPRKRGRPRIHPPTTPLPPELPPPVPPARGRAHPHAPNHEEVIRSWSEVCLTQVEPRPLAQSSVRANAVLWGAWCRWLAGQALHWSDATRQTIETFLDGPAPSLRRQHRPARNPSKMSSLTRVRYFSVLKGAYGHARTMEWIDQVPTVDELQPEYVAKDAQGGVLPPGVLARLQNTRQLQEIFSPTSDTKSHWQLLRDRAAVALVAECGITTAELIELQLRDLGAGPHNIVQAMARAAQRALPGSEREGTPPTPTLNLSNPAIDNPAGARMPAAPVVLTVRPTQPHSERALNGRSFVLPARVCEVLLPWVAQREALLTAMAAQHVPLAQREAHLKKHSLNGPLFPSRQSRKDEKGNPIKDQFFPMESAAVYLIFKRAFAGLDPSTGEGVRGKARTAQGTSVIRNTLIQHWLRTMPEEEAQKRAGFKTLEGMRVIARAAGITTQSLTSPDSSAQGEIEGADTRIDKNGQPGQKAVRRAKGGRV